MSLYYHQDLSSIVTAINALGTKLDTIAGDVNNIYEYMSEMNSNLASIYNDTSMMSLILQNGDAAIKVEVVP